MVVVEGREVRRASKQQELKSHDGGSSGGGGGDGGGSGGVGKASLARTQHYLSITQHGTNRHSLKLFLSSPAVNLFL